MSTSNLCGKKSYNIKIKFIKLNIIILNTISTSNMSSTSHDWVGGVNL